MRVTFSLSDQQYAAADRQGVMVGLPLTAQLHAGLLMPAGNNDAGGWFERVGPGIPLLKSFSLDRSAFLGRVKDVETWTDGTDVVCQVLLDCGCPLRIELWDPGSQAGPSPTPYSVGRGDWLSGVCTLQGLVAFDPGDLLWEPVDGAIVEIQRLKLDPLAPDFGALRWLHGLPRRSFAPDQVYVTIEV